MTQIAKHTFAIAFALFITAVTFQGVVHVPVEQAETAAVILA